VIIAETAISNNTHLDLNMVNPANANTSIAACGQRCQMHNLHGYKPTKYSNQNAEASSVNEIKPQNKTACFNVILT